MQMLLEDLFTLLFKLTCYGKELVTLVALLLHLFLSIYFFTIYFILCQDLNHLEYIVVFGSQVRIFYCFQGVTVLCVGWKVLQRYI